MDPLLELNKKKERLKKKSLEKKFYSFYEDKLEWKWH
jgi:hypothetical protein